MNCAEVSICLELIKGAPTALVALIIGGMTVRVAFQQRSIAAEQKKIAAAKLNLELFERRLAVFEQTKSFLNNALDGGQNGPFSNIPVLSEATFLFGDEVVSYMRLATKNNAELRGLYMRIDANGHVPDPEIVPRLHELEGWFMDQTVDGCLQVFKPYLGFGKWQSP